MKVVNLVGARPQFIKAAMLSLELRKQGIQEVLVHSGQHYDANMSGIFFEQLHIPEPAYRLYLSRSTHGGATGEMLVGIEQLLQAEQPDSIVVYGDTNTTLAGALAAAKLGIPIGHVEAGLRSYNDRMPEEINRVITDKLSSILFCPSEVAIKNLEKEGIKNSARIKVIHSGDIMYDAVCYYKQQRRNLKINTENAEYVLATLHRAENADRREQLLSIIEALNEINRDIRVIMPMHPRTANILRTMEIRIDFSIIAPIGYLEMQDYIANAKLVLTDSGGLQKEAYFHGKYCITYREETEWTELVSAGYNRLTGSGKAAILEAYTYFRDREFGSVRPLYGEGNAAELIVNGLRGGR